LELTRNWLARRVIDGCSIPDCDVMDGADDIIAEIDKALALARPAPIEKD